MKKFYISRKDHLSGISKYSNDFYRLVLKDRNYVFLDSEESIVNILSMVSSKDLVHIEIGIFQKKEIEILMTMLEAKYNNVTVTFHDPPLFKFPFIEFENPLLNKISKFYDIYINRFQQSAKYIRRIKCIYVLTQKGLKEIKRIYKVQNVHYLPHIIDPQEIKVSEGSNKNFLYFGFIGKNKGIEYAMQLHQGLLNTFPNTQFYVIGEAIGKEREHLQFLKNTYTKNVHYMGYISEGAKLEEVFQQSAFSFLPFKDYKFYYPFSGSLLSVMKYGKIPFTNNVNALGEVIEDHKNGFYLSGKLLADVEKVCQVISNDMLIETVSGNINSFLLSNHTSQNVGKYLHE